MTMTQTTTYSEKLKSPQWQRKRLEIFQRDEFMCMKCFDTQTQLQVHHKYYENGKDPHEYPDDCLVTLCAQCHEFIESLKKTEPEFDFDKVVIKKISFLDNSQVIFSSMGDLVYVAVFSPNKIRVVFFCIPMIDFSEMYDHITNKDTW